MAAPTYATDLTTIDDFESGDNTSEPTGSWTAGRGNTTDTDYPIQSSTHASLVMNTTGKAGMVTDASPITWTSGDYLFGWVTWLAPGAISTQALGGLAMLAGSGTGDFKVFYVGGNDFGSSPYGGWQNFAVDPELTADETQGTPDGDYDVVGGGANVLSAVAKGSPLGIDVFRSGRGEMRVALGDGTTPATFAGMAAANDATAAMWGLFQAIDGGYRYKGLMTLGYTSAVTFEDSNVSIVIDNTEFVNSGFNAIEIRQATSDISWENITFASLGTTSPGSFEVIDNATVVMTGCTFNDMSTFDFLSNTDAIGCTFRRCGQVTGGGGLFTDSIIDDYNGTTGTSALVYAETVDPDGELDGMSFTKGTDTTHAIQFGDTIPTTITLRDMTFSGYSAADSADDSTLYFADTAGTITVNLVGCTGNISYDSAGCTVVFVIDPVTLSVHVQDSDLGTDIASARVYVLAATTGPLPFEDTVTITRVTTTATVSHTAHGLATNQWVKIENAVQEDYNGAKQITKIDADSYSYTVANSPTTPATGTIEATAIVIFGTTDANGDISDTRSYSADQDFTGRIRKSSASPYYKTFNLNGTIDSTNGLPLSVGMISDE